MLSFLKEIIFIHYFDPLFDLLLYLSVPNFKLAGPAALSFTASTLLLS